MKLTSAKQQTIFLTGINGIVRALGLCMRICLSRLLGPEAMGIMELAQSAHMLAITPLTSGLPIAVSRLTAKADANSKQLPLISGLSLARRLSILMIPLFWIISPFIARLMGDERVLPSLWFTAPCILILGYSAACNGYCYGIGRSELPAFSELIEQLIRFILTFFLLRILKHLTLPWFAAVPVAATMIAEILGLFFVLSKLPIKQIHHASSAWTRSVLRLAVPATLTRLMQTALRSLTSILIPIRLQASGLSAAESMSQLGMMNGMVSPILMLPGIFTSALSMVMVPRIAKAEEKPSELGRLLRMCLYSTIPLSIVFAVFIWEIAPVLARTLYRQPELSDLFRQCAFQILLFPINHLVISTLSALGQQKRSMYVSSITSIVSLILTWVLAADPALRIKGIIHVQYISQMLSILLGCFMLIRWKTKR